MPTLDSLVSEYNNMSFGLGVAGGESNEYREVRFEVWPTDVHYEFVERTSNYQVEFHWEHEIVPGLPNAVDTIFAGAQAIFGQFNPTRTEAKVKKHRIALYLPTNFSACDIAGVMHHFIAWSRPIIDDVARSCSHAHR